ncbi:MAG TPA: tetratricopeptide repeat protein [Terriglobia bacterium]|nr:tetratricopeptide repeat protein [Terriglobia bacterium]
MARHAVRGQVLTVLLDVSFFFTAFFAQSSVSKPAVPTPTAQGIPQNSQEAAGASQSALGQSDPEMDAIEQAISDDKLVEAQKLLAAAIRKAESTPGSEKRLGLLFNLLSSVDMRQGACDDAIAALERTLALDKKLFGAESTKVGRDLNNLAMFRLASQKAGESATAEQEYQQALAIARQNPDPHSWLLMMVANNLAQYYLRHNRAASAEPLINEALLTCQANPAADQLKCRSLRSLLAHVYRAEGHANAAVGMSFEAAAADATSQRPWPEKLRDLESLARQYEQDRSYDLAETTYRQALELAEANTRPDDPGPLPDVMNALGNVLVKEGQNANGEALFKQALNLQEQAASSKARKSPLWLNFADLANLYRTEGRLAEIEPIILHGIAVQEQISGSGSEALAESLLALARVYNEEKKYSDAEPICERALKIKETDYGPESPQLLGAIEAYAEVLHRLGKTDQARALVERAIAIRDKYPAQQSH